MLGRQEKDGAEDQQVWGGLGARLAVGGVVAFGALASGFLLSRRGRRLVVDTFRGARRTQLADRVLDRFWSDPMLGRRRLDVVEPEEGVLVLVGSVASDRERQRAAKVASSVPGVIEVRDRLVLDPSLVRRRAGRRLSERR
jgi:hypothetical protein